jgi:hypothetical protein
MLSLQQKATVRHIELQQILATTQVIFLRAPDVTPKHHAPAPQLSKRGGRFAGISSFVSDSFKLYRS